MCKCHVDQRTDGSHKGVSGDPSSPPGNQPSVIQYRETVDHLYSQMQTFKSILAVDSSWDGYAIF